MDWQFLIDENQEPRVATALAKEGITAEHVTEALGQGTSDSRVLEYARQNDLIIVTNDVKDYSGLDPTEHAGLAIVAAGDRSPETITQALLRMMEAYEGAGGADAFIQDWVDSYFVD